MAGVGDEGALGVIGLLDRANRLLGPDVGKNRHGGFHQSASDDERGEQRAQTGFALQAHAFVQGLEEAAGVELGGIREAGALGGGVADHRINRREGNYDNDSGNEEIEGNQMITQASEHGGSR